MDLFEKIVPIEYDEKVTKETPIPEEKRVVVPDVVTDLPNMETMSFGNGNESLHVASEGLWLGSDKFADAPFSVTMAGKSNIQNSGTDLKAILSAIYYVGSIHIATVPTNPGTIYGFGTWVSFGVGRTLVGVDTTQTEFDVVEETGGAKTVTLSAAESGLVGHNHTQDSHNHTQDSHTHTLYAYSGSGTAGTTNYDRAAGAGGGSYAFWGGGNRVPVIGGTTATNQATTATNQAAASAAASSAHNNLMPYVTTYFWKRTA
jgi:microcystin-dependent protein